MALDTYLGGCLVEKHLLVFSAMGAVAGNASQRKILVAGIDGFFTDRVAGVTSPVMAVEAKVKLMILFCQEEKIR